jgi:hypothetical protein
LGFAFDVTILSPVTKTSMDLAARDFLAFLKCSADIKNNKYKRCLSGQGVGFLPLVVDAFGRIRSCFSGRQLCTRLPIPARMSRWFLGVYSKK